MEIISDPDLTLTEQPTTFGALEQCDVFREAHLSYDEAMEQSRFLMKVSTETTQSAVNLYNGQQINTIDDNVKVIVHIAKLVVTPNI